MPGRLLRLLEADRELYLVAKSEHDAGEISLDNHGRAGGRVEQTSVSDGLGAIRGDCPDPLILVRGRLRGCYGNPRLSRLGEQRCVGFVGRAGTGAPSDLRVGVVQMRRTRAVDQVDDDYFSCACIYSCHISLPFPIVLSLHEIHAVSEQV